MMRTHADRPGRRRAVLRLEALEGRDTPSAFGAAGRPAGLLATTPLPAVDGSNAYWFAREAQIEARARLGHADILFLGDSVTEQLQSAPAWTMAFARLGAADFGVAGATTSQVLWQVQA